MKDKIIYIISILFVNTSTCFVSFAQTKIDTVYIRYSNNIAINTTPDSATYYRVRIISDGVLKAEDYSMKDSVLNCSAYYKTFDPYQRQGHCIFYSNDSVKNFEGDYIDAEMSGVWKKYYSSGELWYTQTYDQGVKNGLLKGYYKTGELKRIEEYENDNRIIGECYTKSGKDTAYYEMYIMPRFPGDDDAMAKYFQENLIYPKGARKKFQEGKVYVRYIILESGIIDTAFVFKSSGYPLLDNAAVQFIQNFPTFTPGYVDGVPVKLAMVQPVLFKLEK